MMKDMRREEGENRKYWNKRNGGPSNRYSWQEQVEQGMIMLFFILHIFVALIATRVYSLYRYIIC